MRTNRALAAVVASTLFLGLTACKQKEVIQTVLVPPSGPVIPLAENGQVVEWRIAATDFVSYTVTFEDGVSPCGTLTLSGTPSAPARCTITGQPPGGYSAYSYLVEITYADGRQSVQRRSLSAHPAGSNPPPGGGGPIAQRVVGCDGCGSLDGSSGTGQGQGQGDDQKSGDQKDRKGGGGGGSGPAVLPPAAAAPGEQEIFCVNNVSTVVPYAPDNPQGSRVYWQTSGAFSAPTITFTGTSPCKAPGPTPGNYYSCTITGDPGSYPYTVKTAACGLGNSTLVVRAAP